MCESGVCGDAALSPASKTDAARFVGCGVVIIELHLSLYIGREGDGKTCLDLS